MVNIVKLGAKAHVTKITCKRCESELEVMDGEWRDGGYGSERHVDCPACNATVTKPGTEYTGDF